MPRIQYRATVLSSHACCCDTLSSPIAFATLLTRFAVIWPATNSTRGMLSPRFARRDFAATNVWVSPESCLASAYTTALTPWLLASPNPWSWISVLAHDIERLVSGLLSHQEASVSMTTIVISAHRQVQHPMGALHHKCLDRWSSLAMSRVKQGPGGHKL
jgi:hypothetical protein